MVSRETQKYLLHIGFLYIFRFPLFLSRNVANTFEILSRDYITVCLCCHVSASFIRFYVLVCYKYSRNSIYLVVSRVFVTE